MFYLACSDSYSSSEEQPVVGDDKKESKPKQKQRKSRRERSRSREREEASDKPKSPDVADPGLPPAHSVSNVVATQPPLPPPPPVPKKTGGIFSRLFGTNRTGSEPARVKGSKKKKIHHWMTSEAADFPGMYMIIEIFLLKYDRDNVTS